MQAPAAPACRLAAQLVAAWGELRQLEALLVSLRAALAAEPAQKPLAPVLAAPAFLATLAEVLSVAVWRICASDSCQKPAGASLCCLTRQQARQY